MSKAALVAKLTANAVKLNKSPTTSPSLLTKSELAGELAGLSEPEMDLAMAKYGKDELSKQRLLNHVQGYVLNKDWKAQSNDLLNAIAVLAVNEVLTENLCPNCNGTGSVISRRFKLLTVVCKTCNGTRHKPKSGREMAKLLGVSNTQWINTWKNRYDFVLEYVCKLNSGIR